MAAAQGVGATVSPGAQRGKAERVPKAVGRTMWSPKTFEMVHGVAAEADASRARDRAARKAAMVVEVLHSAQRSGVETIPQIF